MRMRVREIERCPGSEINHEITVLNCWDPFPFVVWYTASCTQYQLVVLSISMVDDTGAKRAPIDVDA